MSRRGRFCGGSMACGMPKSATNFALARLCRAASRGLEVRFL